MAAAEYLRPLLPNMVHYAVIAGTGLSGLATDLEEPIEISYDNIPYFPQPTVEGHVGKMVIGRMGTSHVLILRGRFHYYEGYSMQEVTFPVRVLKALGIHKLIITNATGALNPNYQTGDIVFIEDHINLFPENPLRGLNDDRLGLRFPALSEVYDKTMLSEAIRLAKESGIRFHQGIYVGLQGPSLETPAEYRYLGKIGGDVVGMSTVPEIIVAAQCELQVLCISVCTNNPFQDGAKTTIEEVLEVANKTGEKIKGLIQQLVA